jgi:hypothetical protein
MARRPGTLQRAVTMREHWVREQEKWIAEHGGDLDGYIKRYGVSRGGPIYEADMLALVELQVSLDRVKGGRS